MTSHFVCGPTPSRYISANKRGFAKYIILLLLVTQVVFVLQPMRTNAHSANATQESKEIPQLEIGKPVEREIAGGENHSYQIPLAAGQYLNAVVEQRGVDVVVTLFGPDGKQLAEVDNPTGAKGSELVTWIVEIAGSYRITVRPLEKNAAAGRYEVKIVELRTATEKDRALQEVNRLIKEFTRLNRAGKYDEARPLLELASEIQEKVLGPEHPEVALSLHDLALLHWRKGDYSKAEVLNQRALAIREKVFGLEHREVAASLNNLGIIYRDMGKYAKAGMLYQRALTIWEKLLGPEHFRVGAALNNLALVYMDTGNYDKAEPLYQRTLTIWEKTGGPESPDVGLALNNLAILYRRKGDYAKAESLHLRTLVIWEKAYGPEDRDVAQVLNNLAIIYFSQGDYAKAEPLLQRALAIKEKAFGPERLEVSQTVTNLAIVYHYTGDYAKAEPLYQRAVDISKKLFEPEHPEVASSLNNLAAFYSDMGEFAKAEPLLERAVAVREKSLGAEHPYLAESLNNLIRLHIAKNEVAQAVTLQLRACAISERNIALNLATGSERQKLAYLATLSDESDCVVSLHARSAPNNLAARNLSTTIILQRKGRVLDAMSDSFAALRRRARPQDQGLFDQLQDTNSQLAQLVLNGPQRTTPDEHRKRIKALEEQKENLEAKISQSSDEFRAQSQPVTLASVRSAIPANAALVEFVVYRPFNAKYTKPGEQFGPPRYAAYLLLAEGEPQWVELDEAKAIIDAAIEKWREALRDPKRNDVKRLARKVEAMVMQPVRALLGRTQRVLLSPDGALNLIPFAALVDEQNHYLVERYSITYLTSGRDLLRLQVLRENKSDPLIVADPDFGALAGEGTQLTHNSRRPTARRRNRGPIRNISQAYFEPLPETGREAKALKTLLPQATVLTKEQATEAALKKAHAPRILHIATHGFFLEDSEAATANARIENPLLRSGLALAGFNQHKSGDDDGALTALEAAGLNLWGTKLVVLSACDTGVGEVKNGEGVYGLRRALVLAGSESLVMSLWSVSDYWTRRLMVGYYTALQQGQGRGAALRQVQMQMLKSKTQQHPYYWASFIQSGEWANLDGKR